MSASSPRNRVRGRGAGSNQTGRFEKFVTEMVDDGWGLPDDLPPLRTEVSDERPRRIITHNTSPDVPFDRSINPYRGCEHGCIYCFARPSHAYLGHSPGLDFETKLIARPDAASVLEAELHKPGYMPEVIAIGTNTDPYQPLERERRVMRGILEILAAFRHPVGIATKGTLVERDAALLAEMSAQGLARVGISITTLDPEISRRMEPRVPSPARRLRALERLSEAGVETRVMVSPIVPGLTDPEIETILQAAKDAGAKAASMITLRLPREVSELWRDWLHEHYPDRFNRIMSKIREMHGGQDYDAQWGRRMTGEGIYARLLQDRFLRASRNLGLPRDLPPLRTDLFAPPPRAGDQLALF